MNYIYLHGFTSGSQSEKAIFFHDRLQENNIKLEILDFNQPDFTNLTLTRQLNQLSQSLPKNDQPVTLIGSSMGGLTAAITAQKHPQIKKLILLAPALTTVSYWLETIGPEKMKQWETDGFYPIYHHIEKRELPLNYNFVIDAKTYDNLDLTRNIPTLIFHGTNDEIIPITISQNYAQTHPWVKLIPLNSDHSLVTALPEIWSNMKEWLASN